jgi:hypothetical protein
MTDKEFEKWIDAEFKKIDRDRLIGYSLMFLGFTIISLSMGLWSR